MGVAAKIGELAKEKGIALKEISREVGIPYTTLYNAVKRDSKMELETVQCIAEVLNVEWYVLYENNAGVCLKDNDEKLADACKYLEENLHSLTHGIRIRSADKNNWIESHLQEAAKKYDVSENDLRRVVSHYADWEDILGDEQYLLIFFHQLNAEGQRIAAERVEELAQIPKYQRTQESPQDTPTRPDDKTPAEK